MGLFSSKTKSKSTSISSAQMRDWAKPLVKGFAGKTVDFMNSDPHQFVAPTSTLQSKAFGDVAGLGGWKTPASQAMAMATEAGGKGPAAASASLAGHRSVLDDGGIQKYMDPALDGYVDSAMAAYDADSGRRYAALQGASARNGAFGGSRYGVALGDFQAQDALNRSLAYSNMMRDAYAQATQLASAEADRFQQADINNAGLQTDVSKTNANFQEQQYLRSLQAAGLLGELSDSMADNARDDVSLTGQLGEMQRGIDKEYRNAVPTQLQIGGNLLGAVPQDSYLIRKTKTKGTTTSGGGIGGQLLGAGLSAAATAFSDGRLKTDIAPIGNHGPLGLYRFRFIGDDRPRLGVMADEVAVHAPDALGPEIGGYATVDYGKLGLAHLIEEE